jgi:hypothetical protein
MVAYKNQGQPPPLVVACWGIEPWSYLAFCIELGSLAVVVLILDSHALEARFEGSGSHWDPKQRHGASKKL